MVAHRLERPLVDLVRRGGRGPPAAHVADAPAETVNLNPGESTVATIEIAIPALKSAVRS